MASGYSGKTTIQKLGIIEGMKLCVINSPSGYESIIGDLPAEVSISNKLSGNFDMIHIFCTEERLLKQKLESAKKHVKINGMIWVSWPKKSSGIITGINENIIRETGLNAGMVDVKVCAVDENWSGLKFVFRLKDRK
jgi:hypothetical protein